jgi:hypothetical protein
MPSCEWHWIARRSERVTSRRKKADSESVAGRWTDRVSPLLGEIVRRGGLRLALLVTIAAALVFGLKALEGFNRTLPRDAPTPTVHWVGLPEWLVLEANRYILEDLETACALSPVDRVLDSTLARRIAENLAERGRGWVADVERVEIHPNGIVAVQCRFRRPLAWVQHGDACYLIAEDGVRLPGRYLPSDASQSGLMIIRGVSGPVPPVGSPWPGADAKAGVRVVEACYTKAFRQQITAVAVDNYGGRLARRRPHIELVTNRPGRRIWWGRAPGEEDGFEISAAQKLVLLESLYLQWGRVDMDRPYVSVMTWPDRVVLPVTSDAEEILARQG